MDLRYTEQGKLTLSHDASFPIKDRISFIGPISGGDKIRSHVRQLNITDMKERLVDLGNLTPKGVANILSVIHEFENQGGPVLVCLPTENSKTFCRDFTDSGLSSVIITNRTEEYMSKHSNLAIQNHFFHPDFIFDETKHIRLGELKQNISLAEVALRTSDYVWLDIASLKFGDNIGHARSSSAGLTIEELCMIAKYTGASANLRAVVIHGYDENQDSHNIMASNIALLMYYLLDGYRIALADRHHQFELNRYTVIPDNLSSALTFIEDKVNGRWWVEMYSQDARDEVKIPCSEKDYFDACNNNISDRITNLLATI